MRSQDIAKKDLHVGWVRCRKDESGPQVCAKHLFRYLPDHGGSENRQEDCRTPGQNRGSDFVGFGRRRRYRLIPRQQCAGCDRARACRRWNPRRYSCRGAHSARAGRGRIRRYAVCIAVQQIRPGRSVGNIG
ncbi:small GTPase superfamily Rab type protein [Rhizobium gallicum bv. gallicum R602sp]|uniref:Small GTPase superfamily Rab type protein n=1 Tax=Rhizobium gallicum bv. gallicum R602sp TaxID=1041138 RepID=A0A0B4X2H1_9HYPH|nr:small GTPase superfamily Rab type protein [Rhizobium gallicum bv. gallicum R602sp]